MMLMTGPVSLSNHVGRGTAVTNDSSSSDLDVAVRALSDPGALMGRIVDEALRLIPSAQGSVVEFADRDQLFYAYAAGTLSTSVGLRLNAGGSLSGHSVRLGTTLRCDDSEIDPRVDREACRTVKARSMVCVPLRCADRPVGVLKVTSSSPSAFSDRDVATLAGLSTFITAVITAAADLGGATNDALALSDSAAKREVTPDTDAMSVFIANVLRPGVVEDLEAARRVQSVLADRSYHMVFQPIFELESGRVKICEALSRFTAAPLRGPGDWFHEAWKVGLGPELELATAAAAIDAMESLPHDCRIAINVSPPLIEHPGLTEVLESIEPGRLILEITEHMEAEDFQRTRRLLNPLRRRGVHVAMDDTGSGFSSLSRIIELSPEVIKLDFGLVHGIDFDPVRRSLATAIVNFASDVSAIVVAEGIETEDELRTVRDLGVHYGQGFLLARPADASTMALVVSKFDGLGA